MRWKLTFEIETPPQSNGELWIPFNILKVLAGTALWPPAYQLVGDVEVERIEDNELSSD